MPQTALAVAQGDTVRYTDHNKVVTDLADLYATNTTNAALLPTAGQKSALAGTTGTPGAANKYVTETDTRIAAAGGTGVYRPSGGGGGVKVQSGDAGAAATATVTFPVAFSTAPVVMLSVNDTSTGRWAKLNSVSATGFSFDVRTIAGTQSGPTGSTYWQAIGT